MQKESLFLKMNISINDVRKAFEWLKRENYYDTMNLFLREKIAKFECDPEFENIISQLAFEISDLSGSDNNYFIELLKKINFRLIPKTFDKDNKSQESYWAKSFISNNRKADEYKLDSFNYFIDAPIEIFIISILWCHKVGRILDKKLDPNCLGNRINKKVSENNPYSIFSYYLPLYNKWRDKAINIGLSNLENDNDILLIALDITECYYNLEVNWEKINDCITKETSSIDECRLLTELLEEIHKTYRKKIIRYLKLTHYSDTSRYINKKIPNSIIPIGLPSSGIIANWELSLLDKKIKNNLRPLYYGRYVDDILIVINNPNSELLHSSSPNEIINEYFIKTEIFKSEDKNLDYEKEASLRINDYQFLFVQKNKLIIQYYDHNSHWAGLTKFKKELQKQASIFRFLPENFSENDFSDEAYDIEYNGSINKLRNVIGVNENANKLISFLFNIQLKKWLTKNSLNNKLYLHILKFFQGRNILNNFRVWERIFAVFLTDANWKMLEKTVKDVESSINKINYEDEFINQKIKTDFKLYLLISLSITLGLLGTKQIKQLHTKIQLKNLEEIKQKSSFFRISKLIRHQFSSWPLLEYTSESVNLLDFESFKDSFDKESTDFIYAPRYIHFEEYQLFLLISNGIKKAIKFSLEEIFEKYKKDFLSINKLENSLSFFENDRKKEFIDIEFENNDEKKQSLIIGLVNIKIPSKNITATLSPPRISIASDNLQDHLFYIFNEADKKKRCDLLIFPEVSIPFHFLPFIVNQAHRRQIGVVFGCEHVVEKNECFNLVVAVLPNRNINGYSECLVSIRNKNHYSPREKIEIESYDLKLPKIDTIYHRYTWRNCCFSVYNCFELTDISHRSKFRSYVDLLIGISWNKDKNYYANIVESTDRDLHCYFAYANTSHFGDSRIVAPKKTEIKDIIRISGGENCVLLKGKIDIKELRDYQKHTYDPLDERFKPTPAGFDHEIVRNERKI